VFESESERASLCARARAAVHVSTVAMVTARAMNAHTSTAGREEKRDDLESRRTSI